MILLTGGLGYIGSHTCVELFKKGEDVVIIDNLSNCDISVLERLTALTGKTPRFYPGNVQNEELLNRVFAENQIHSVIHFAGLKAVGESVAKPLKYYENNIDSTLVLLKYMEKYEVNTLVFSSSATVYAGDNEMPLRETSRLMPVNPYGWTKFMIEQMLIDWQKANTSKKIALLRYFNPVGAHDSGLIGEMPNDIPNNLMPRICDVAFGKMEYLTVFGSDYDTEDGTGVRDYIHICDLAEGHVKALDFLAGNEGVHIFNLGTGKGYSVMQLLKEFEKANDIQLPYKMMDRRPGDNAVCYSDAAKANEQLNWSPKRSLHDMCRSSYVFRQKAASEFK